MNLIWILFAMPMAALLYTIWVVGRSQRLKRSNQIASLRSLGRTSGTDRELYFQRQRRVKWISLEELESLARGSDDVILVDLLPKGVQSSRRLPGASLLIEPTQFHDVLRWAPSSCSVVLYGPSNLCKRMVKAAREIDGSAPLYVVSVDPQHSEEM